MLSLGEDGDRCHTSRGLFSFGVPSQTMILIIGEHPDLSCSSIDFIYYPCKALLQKPPMIVLGCLKHLCIYDIVCLLIGTKWDRPPVPPGPPSRASTDREWVMMALVDEVTRIHDGSDGTYGAPRIHAELRDEGWQVSEKTVAKAMRLAGIQGISPRRWHPVTTVHADDPSPVPDLLNRRFDQGGKDRAWVSDITYVAWGRHWAYLCAVRDAHTRRVLGRIVEDHMRADLVEAALRQAVALRGVLPVKVIFHADHGCQFTS